MSRRRWGKWFSFVLQLGAALAFRSEAQITDTDRPKLRQMNLIDSQRRPWSQPWRRRRRRKKIDTRTGDLEVRVRADKWIRSSLVWNCLLGCRRYGWVQWSVAGRRLGPTGQSLKDKSLNIENWETEIIFSSSGDDWTADGTFFFLSSLKARVVSSTLITVIVILPSWLHLS